MIMYINFDRNFSLAFLINDLSFKYSIDIKNRLLPLPLRFPYSHILDYMTYSFLPPAVILKGFEYCKIVLFSNVVCVSKSNKVCKLCQFPFKSMVKKYSLTNVSYQYDQITSYIIAFQIIHFQLLLKEELSKAWRYCQLRNSVMDVSNMIDPFSYPVFLDLFKSTLPL